MITTPEKRRIIKSLVWDYHIQPDSVLSGLGFMERWLEIAVEWNNLDGLVKSPTAALCCISQSFNVRQLRLMIAKFARLEFELFTKPSKSDFLRSHQS